MIEINKIRIKKMQDFICENCFIKVDGWVYDDNNLIDNLYYCDDCYNAVEKIQAMEYFTNE
tara:strand:- start:134 stop:316 length:183 start_codon:yes stop_codon:yes gene_type:complete